MIRHPQRRGPLLVHAPRWTSQQELDGFERELSELADESPIILVADADQYRIEYVGPRRFVSRFRKRSRH